MGIDKNTGELVMLTPASSQHTSRGQYELKIRANDSGKFRTLLECMHIGTYYV